MPYSNTENSVNAREGKTEPSLKGNRMEGVETMHGGAATAVQEIVRTARISEGADADRNDRQTRVIYAAGFFDGEGSISIVIGRGNQIGSLFISVGQIDERPLHLLKNLWGGSINLDNKRVSRWRLNHQKARDALAEMLPYLIVKREQAEVAIEFLDGRPDKPKRHADAKSRGREATARYRARRRGESIVTPPRPRWTPEQIGRTKRYQRLLRAARL